MKRKNSLLAAVLGEAAIGLGLGLFLTSFVFAAGDVSSGTATGTTGSAIISGKVSLAGKAPALAKIDLSADPTCRAQHSNGLEDETVLQNTDGTLQNVFVYVKEGAGNYPAPASTVTLDQKGCHYVPHVMGIQVGQPMVITNSDDTLHNIHCVTLANDRFNIGQPTQGMKATKVFSAPEVMVKLKCDVHSWMRCYVGVLPHPFFNVTGSDGTFKISGLPAGTYTLEAWQEKYGTVDQKVEIKDGETKSVNFTFKVVEAKK